MTKILQQTEKVIHESHSIVDFMTEGGEHWPVWDRFITLEGKKAYHIGNVCETCAFLFERMEGTNKRIGPQELSDRLKEGVDNLDTELVETISALMPIGAYQVYLLEVTPKLVLPGSETDYFSHEQTELWGIDPFWGFPHFPKIDYYRLSTNMISNKSGIFEFLVPLFPKTWLNGDTVKKYQRLETVPTAIALSVLDVKEPADPEENAELQKHYCLAHYLLDGHHKTYAMSQQGEKMNLISFLAVDKGISLPNDIERVFSSFSKSE